MRFCFVPGIKAREENEMDEMRVIGECRTPGLENTLEAEIQTSHGNLVSTVFLTKVKCGSAVVTQKER